MKSRVDRPRHGGRRIALFRAREDAGRTAARLRRFGFSAAVLPVVETVALPIELPETEFDGVIATSAKAFLSSVAPAAPLYAVGARTARAAKDRGWTIAAPAAPDAARLVEILKARAPAGARLLYLAGHDRKPTLEAALKSTFLLDVVEAYQASPRTSWSPAEVTALASCVGALHYSRRSAELAARLANQAGAAEHFVRLRHICLSRDVAEAVAAVGADAEVARAPDEASLFATLCSAPRRFPSHRGSNI